MPSTSNYSHGGQAAQPGVWSVTIYIPGPLKMPTNLTSLPVELRAQVLDTIGSIENLKSAVTSNPSFRDAFHEYQSQILNAVLCDEIGSDLLPDAIMVERVARGCRDCQQSSLLNVHGIIMKLRDDKDGMSQCTMEPRLAIALSRRHRYIEALSNVFMQQCIERMTNLFGTRVAPPTATERLRILRAFYRFEMFWLLFLADEAIGDDLSEDEVKLLRSFFDLFAPWENEELECVNTFLYQILLPAFNDVAFHDILWGAYGVEYADSMHNTYVKRIMTRGFKRMLAITNATSYEDRIKELGSVPPSGINFPKAEAIYHFGRTRTREWRRFFHPDPDGERAELWKWLCENLYDRVYEESFRALRSWCYVSWDWERLNSLGFFDVDWVERTRRWNDKEEEWDDWLFAHKRPMRDLVWSSNQRARLYRRGERGYWPGIKESGSLRAELPSI